MVFAGVVLLNRLWGKYAESGYESLVFDDFVPILIFLVILIFSILLRLDIMIDERGVGYKWYPFRRKYAIVPWSSIESIRLRRYSAIADYGGYGLRFTFKSTAYIVSGNYGIEITYHNRKRKFLLGVTKPEEARRVIEQHFDCIDVKERM